MRRYVINTLATTGLSLITLSVVALMFHASFLEIASVFEALAANIMIHVGLQFVKKIECKSAAVESIMDVGFIVAVLVVFGAVFSWFTSTPIWVLIMMAVVIYLLSTALNLFRMQQEVNEINALLDARNKKDRTGA